MPTLYRQYALCALRNPHIHLGGRWRQAQLFRARVLLSRETKTGLGPQLAGVQRQSGSSCPRLSSKHVRLISARCDHLQSLIRTMRMAQLVRFETLRLRGQQRHPHHSTQNLCACSNRHIKHPLAFLPHKLAQRVRRSGLHDLDRICWFSLI